MLESLTRLPSVITGILRQAGLQLPEDSHKPPFADSGRVSRICTTRALTEDHYEEQRKLTIQSRGTEPSGPQRKEPGMAQPGTPGPRQLAFAWLQQPLLPVQVGCLAMLARQTSSAGGDFDVVKRKMGSSLNSV